MQNFIFMSKYIKIKNKIFHYFFITLLSAFIRKIILQIILCKKIIYIKYNFFKKSKIDLYTILKNDNN